MGSPKPFVEVGGLPMARRVADALLGGGCTAVTAVGGDAAGLDVVGLSSVPDRWPGEGPLGAVITALDQASRRGATRVVIAACDLPFLTAASVAALLEVPLPVVVAVGERIQPLFSAWDPALAAVLESEFMAGERRILSVLDRLADVGRIDVAAADLLNVNHPGDLPQ